MAHVDPRRDATRAAHELAAALGYTEYGLLAQGVPNGTGRPDDAGWNEVILVRKGTQEPLDLKGRAAPRYRGIVNAH